MIERNICDLYLKGWSMSKISKEIGKNYRFVKKTLVNNNIEIFSNNRYKSKKCDENYFDRIDSEDKAYWLGFIYADGNITHYKVSDRFQIKLGIADIEHLRKIKSCLNSSHKIGVYSQKTPYGDSEYCSFGIANQHLVNSLIEKGVVYKKTKKINFPNNNIVPEELIPHFIRGYFDGDGSIYWVNNIKRNAGCFSIIGNKEFLEKILEHIKKEVTTNSSLYKYKDKEIYEIRIGGRNNLKNIYNYLYKESSLFLSRKEKKFKEIIGE